MIDRYTLTSNSDELSLVLGVEVPQDYAPQFNAAPSKKLPVISSFDKHHLSFFNWGLMSQWSNNRAMSSKLFNLQVDNVIKKPAYAKKIKQNRCIIPMDGFYLWKKIAKKKQIPYYFFFTDKRIFAVPGILEEQENKEFSFSLLTMKSISQIADYQDDMPLVLDMSVAKKWLENGDISVLRESQQNPRNNQFVSQTVSPKITNLQLNDYSLIEPSPATDQHGNYTLFT